MKLLLLLILPMAVLCQNIPTTDGQTVYLDTVIEVDSASKDALYGSALLWISDYFKSSKAVTDIADKEMGVIVAKGNTAIEIEHPFGYLQTRCYYTLKLSFKDARYRLEVYDIYYKPDKGEWTGSYYQPPPTTYPSTWFMPKIGKRSVKVCEQYRDRTLDVLQSILSSSKSKIIGPLINDSW